MQYIKPSRSQYLDQLEEYIHAFEAVGNKLDCVKPHLWLCFNDWNPYLGFIVYPGLPTRKWVRKPLKFDWYESFVDRKLMMLDYMKCLETSHMYC